MTQTVYCKDSSLDDVLVSHRPFQNFIMSVVRKILAEVKDDQNVTKT